MPRLGRLPRLGRRAPGLLGHRPRPRLGWPMPRALCAPPASAGPGRAGPLGRLVTTGFSII